MLLLLQIGVQGLRKACTRASSQLGGLLDALIFDCMSSCQRISKQQVACLLLLAQQNCHDLLQLLWVSKGHN
jgi:hypothetical protein